MALLGSAARRASSRQHASRLVTHSASFNFPRPKPDPRDQEMEFSAEEQSRKPTDIHLHASQNAATGGEERKESHLLTVQDVAHRLQVPVSWVYEHTRPRCSNPLPCIKLGKYLRFCSADIMNYLRSTPANSVCFALNSHDHRG